jgi:alpha-L-rhamnosidase
VNRKLELRFSDLKMDKCSGAVPTPDGLIELSWKKEGNQLVYTLKTPPQWDVTVDKLSKKLDVVAAP